MSCYRSPRFVNDGVNAMAKTDSVSQIGAAQNGLGESYILG